MKIICWMEESPPAVDAAVKLAPTAVSLVITRRHAVVPEQAPVHAEKVELDAGLAVSVMAVPVVKLALHVCPQLMPAGALLTIPVPVPEDVTVSWTVAGGGPGEALKFAVTDMFADRDRVHVPSPEQGPDHPAKTE